VLCLVKSLLTHWGAAADANPQWVIFLVFTEVLPSANGCTNNNLTDHTNT